MDAFKDDLIKAIFNAIGGDDTIRLLPYIDFDVIKNNPKIFTGYPDTTTNHLMIYKTGIVSYYGLAVMTTIVDYGKIDDYVLEMMKKTFFEPEDQLEIYKAPYYYADDDEKIWWKKISIYYVSIMQMSMVMKFYKEVVLSKENFWVVVLMYLLKYWGQRFGLL